VSAPVRLDGRIVGVVSVAKPSQSINLFLDMARPKIVLAALLAAVGVVLAGWLTSLWLSTPIQRLLSHARAVRDGASPPLPDLGGSEVRELGLAFEEMRRAVEGRHYVEQYVHAMTHELKSPLTAIQAASEILSEDPPPEVRQRFVRNIGTESVRMRETVDRLLELSSLEGRSGLANLAHVDLGTVVRLLLEALSGLAEARGVSLRKAGETSCRGEEFLLERALRNLLANALDFAPEGSEIRVDLRTENGHSVVDVSDRGPGVPDYARSKVFERFYSLPRPNGGRKSSGLGLPFVREVARLHGGSAELLDRDGGGTIARLVI
jgi:two-component system sensor histidine kinase CreC